jgi:transposase InsO family protein
MVLPIIKNTAKNIIFCIKSFCLWIGNPLILQSDNGVEYKNKLVDEFCLNNNIKHIYSSPFHPSTNDVVKVAHKE